MKRAYKYRMYPTAEQKLKLSKHFGCARFIFNHFLELRKSRYKENGQSMSWFDCNREAKALKHQADYSWLKEVNSQSLNSSLKNLQRAFVNFFEGRARFPRFKSRRSQQLFHCPQHCEVKGDRLLIPKFREGIRLCVHRPLEGLIKNVTIKKTVLGEYYASIQVEVAKLPSLARTGKSVGLDLGLHQLITTSDGEQIAHPRTLWRFGKQLSKACRDLSRKQRGSRRYENQRRKVARLHKKIRHIRHDHVHQATIRLIRQYDVISIEDLHVKGMLKNRRLSKSISDAVFGELRRQLTYKSKWYGKTVVVIDRFFPSTKRCYECGYDNEVKLSDRQIECQGCGRRYCRDENAAKNINREGKRKHSAGTAENGRGVKVSRA